MGFFLERRRGTALFFDILFGFLAGFLTFGTLIESGVDEEGEGGSTGIVGLASV